MDGYYHLVQCPFHEAKVQLKVEGKILFDFRLLDNYRALPNG